jgi:hypothetical protein
VASAVFGSVALQFAEGFAPIGEYLYVPDLNTLRVCSLCGGTRKCLRIVPEESAAAERRLGSGLMSKVHSEKGVAVSTVLRHISYYVAYRSHFWCH